MKTYKGLILKRSDIPEHGIFVFGSNTEGRHSKGSALVARLEFGAEYGNPQGPQGKSYAIITKDLTKNVHPSIPKVYIEIEVINLYHFVHAYPDLLFYVAYGLGRNLNGYTPEEMASMFSEFPIPENMVFEEGFSKLLTPKLAA